MPHVNQIITASGEGRANNDVFSTLLPASAQNPVTASTAEAVTEGIFGGVKNLIPEEIQTDLQMISDYRLGTFLRRLGSVSGTQASLIDGAIDFIRKDSTQLDPLLTTSFSYSKKFIPIVLVTEFTFLTQNNDRKPFYVIFDSTPEELLSVSKAAQYRAIPVLGRPEPVQIFETTSATTFTLSGKFFANSRAEHPGKLRIADRLFALTTPTKEHYMPSPVEVRIGEWKRLRCIVNDVKIKYEGPWWMGRSLTANSESVTDETLGELKLHAPYLYTAEFSFTIVSERNTSQYAEDIIKDGYKDGYTSTDSRREEVFGELSRVSSSVMNLQDSLGTETTRDNSYISRYQVERARGSNLEYLKNLGIPITENSSLRLASHAQLTSGLYGEITKLGSKIFQKQIADLSKARSGK